MTGRDHSISIAPECLRPHGQRHAIPLLPRPPSLRARSRCFGRGALLLEVMLALTLFVLAAIAILALMSQAWSTFERSRREAVLTDLARTALAQIEAGIAEPETLSGPVAAWPWPVSDEPPSGASKGRDSRWELRISTKPTETIGITLIEVQAVHLDAEGEPDSSVTLRQAVARRNPGGTGEIGSSATRGRVGSQAEPSASLPSLPSVASVRGEP